MEVRRINSELYHHGVKGQRWGHRKQHYGDIRDSGNSRIKQTTGQSKGVHRRTNENGTALLATGKSTNNNFLGYSHHVGGSSSIYNRQKLGSKSIIKSNKPYSINNTNSTGNYSGVPGYVQTKEEFMKEKRSAQYKEGALASRLENEERIKNSKKFISKLKLFGRSFKEVHSENIKKGADFVKNMFKR